MIGGTWVGAADGAPVVEFRYQWSFNNTVLKGTGVIGKGSAHEVRVEAFIGWDAGKKNVYYIDFHGGGTVFKGTVHLDGDDLIFDFETLVGPPAKYRTVARFPDKNTYEATISAEKDGKWMALHKVGLVRKKS